MIEKKTESCSNKNCCFELKDYGLLVLRLILGIFMLTHGWAKLSNFSEMSQGFPAMLGMSPALGLSLIIFAEFFCSIALLFGFSDPACCNSTHYRYVGSCICSTCRSSVQRT